MGFEEWLYRKPPEQLQIERKQRLVDRGPIRDLLGTSGYMREYGMAKDKIREEFRGKDVGNYRKWRQLEPEVIKKIREGDPKTLWEYGKQKPAEWKRDPAAALDKAKKAMRKVKQSEQDNLKKDRRMALRNISKQLQDESRNARFDLAA